MKGRGGSSSGKGGSPGGARVPRGSGDDSSGSDSILGSPEPHGDILGRPTVDPWYRSGERFPSVPASLQPPPAGLGVAGHERRCCGRMAVEWADWIDSELADRGFCDRLEQAGVLRSILISRCSNMFRDTEALRQLVRRWCPSTHTFFFAHREMTVTLEDIENQWLLPILGDQDPAEIALSPEELKIEAVLADYIGRKNVALGTQAARFNSWMEHFLRIEDPLIRRAAFVSYWLSKCVFGEHPAYSIKPLYFCLTVKIAAGELAGASCHIVSTAFNSSIVHTFIWEHALEYIRKGKKPYEIRKKFASMPEGVVANVGDFQGDVPAVFRWVGNKFYDHSLIPSLDSEGKVCWRPYRITHRGFVYESVMSGFRDVEAQDYTLIAGDVASLTYLSATNAGWLPVLSPDGPQFTIYSAHRVRRQFGFDQEIPAVMGIAAGEIPTINPFLRVRAFAYWSSVAPRVIVPNGNRIGVYTTGMANYWRGLMAAMVEFRDSGRRDISHLLESYTSPLPHPRLFTATNTMTTYANRQSLGYAVWHHEESHWVLHGSPHPPLWLRDHPHVAAPGKVPSSKGKRNVSASTPIAVKRKQPDRSKKREAVSKDSPAQASKRVKTTAGRVGKEVLALKTAVQDPVPADETVAEGVSAPVSKKPVRKTRAGKKTFVPPAFPSAPASIAARVAARKSGRGIVYSEKRSKQRADTAARVPIEISDDLSSTSSSSGEDDVSGAAAEETENEDVEAATAEETESENAAAAVAEETESENAEAAAAEETESEGTEAAAAEETESEGTEAAAAEAVSGAGDFTADISSPDIGSLDTDAIINASSEEKDVGAGASIEDDEVSMGELRATGAASDSAERVVETTPITVTSSGGTVQGDISESGSHVDPSLLDSSPSTRQYVRRARRGSLVSTDSERTASATARVPTPPSPLGESGGTAPTPIITAAVVSAATTVQGDETAPVLTEEVPGHEEVLAHIPEVPEGNILAESTSIDENLVTDGDFNADMAHVEPAEVAASEEPVQADVTPGRASVALPLPSLPASIAPSLHHGATSSLVTTSRHHFLPPSLSAFSLSFIVTKLQWCSLSLGVCLGRSHRHGVVLDRGETSPDLSVRIRNYPKTRPTQPEPTPSYDEAWANAEDNMAGDQVADMEVTAPVAAQTSPTRTARSGRETIVEEEGRLQAAAVESAVRGQPGLLSAARPATSRTSVLADMDAFFREFDRTSFSSRHAEHFWTFDDVKADFEVFRVPRGGIRFLKALWEKYGSCSSYFSRGVHVGSSLLTLLCCVLAHMEHTRLGDITEVHILEWKAVVQEAIEGGFKFGFILDYLRRLAHDIFSRRVLAELREAEARACCFEGCFERCCTKPMGLGFCQKSFCRSSY
uniref:Aminotransferase-like plant mobile domain-containing protein n=1 Tax=Fagus sylvatica TaxID=28930 RepID=A0A2N9H9H2_FAGSY